MNAKLLLDPWTCRIQRAHLHELAADPRLRGRERVLMALLAALHSEGKHPGEGTASLADLERVTAMHRRSVRRVLSELMADQVLTSAPSPKGRLWRLQGAQGLRTARRLRTPEPESAHPLDQNRAQGSAQPTRTEVGANGAHPLNEEEEKNFLKKEEQAPSGNGSGTEDQRAFSRQRIDEIRHRLEVQRRHALPVDQDDRDPDDVDPDDLPVERDPDDLPVPAAKEASR